MAHREEPLGEPDAGRHALVEEDGRQAGERRLDLGDDADVVRIAHQVERGDGTEQAGQPDEAAFDLFFGEAAGAGLGDGDPEGGGLELFFGQVDLAPADVLVGVELDLLEDGGLVGDADLAVGEARGVWVSRVGCWGDEADAREWPEGVAGARRSSAGGAVRVRRVRVGTRGSCQLGTRPYRGAGQASLMAARRAAVRPAAKTSVTWRWTASSASV